VPSFRESLHPRSTRAFQWYPVLQGEAAKIFLASVSSGIYVMWPNREKCCAWTIVERCGCLVAHLTSSFHTWWYHLIPNSFHKRHWLRASILSTSLLVTARHSEPYRKMARMWVLYSFSLVETEVFWLPDVIVYILRSRTSDGITTWNIGELGVVEMPGVVWKGESVYNI